MERRLYIPPLLIILLLLLFLNSCGDTSFVIESSETNLANPEETVEIQEPEELKEELIVYDDSPIISSSISFVDETLTLSQAPAVNEIVDLTYTLEVLTPEVKKITRIWLEFERYDPSLYYPLGRSYDKDKMLIKMELLDVKESDYYQQLLIRKQNQPESIVPPESIIVEGDEKWEGTPLQQKEQVQLNSKVRFPETGEWVVTVKSQEQSGKIETRETLYFTVYEEYGVKGRQRNYEPNTSPSRLGDEPSICIEATIDRAPELNNPARLTYTLLSNTTANNVIVKIEFGLREAGGPRGEQIPSTELMDKNDITWEGSLQPFSPVEKNVEITFPETGDWEVLLSGTNPNGLFASSTIYLNIGDNESRFGWVESHLSE